MSKQEQQKPRGVPNEEPVGIFAWLRDRLYDTVYREGDFALQFVAEFIRGPDQLREEEHLKRQMRFQTASQKTGAAKQKQLSSSQQKIFVDILKRRPGENQVLYWKRKKAWLNHPNKQELVLIHMQALERETKQKTDQIEIAAGHFTPVSQKQKQTQTNSRKR